MDSKALFSIRERDKWADQHSNIGLAQNDRQALLVHVDALTLALRRMVGLVDRVNGDLLTPDLSQFKAYIEAVALLECSEADRGGVE